MPPFEVEHMVEAASECAAVVTYRIFTAPFDSMIETNKNAFFFDIYATAEFALGTSMPKEHFGAFVAAGGLLVVWPYLRQTIADLSQRLGFPPLYLPMLTVPVPPPPPECPTPVQQ
ncbi:MAG: protein-export chaperone SecB [candidate division WOR-3 bacterium]|nr:protein-export chaperone SecB [candidate division WOR-3 bacterium]